MSKQDSPQVRVPRSAASSKLPLKRSPIPYYAQLREALRTQILDGTLASHDQVPSENQLVDMFGVSRITVRQALQELENEGLIFRVHGKGTFVSKPRAFQDLTTLQSFGEAMHPHGHETFSKVVSVRERIADGQQVERLGLTENERVVEIRRVRYLNREPMSCETSYLSLGMGRRLAREDLATQDILVLLENALGAEVGDASLVLGSTLADDMHAAELGIQIGSPMLHIERLVKTSDGAPLMFEHLFHRGDAYRYTVNVKRKE